ncbi:hypothetical protein H8B09_25745 [Paenibacillus sp. PR3]|uniref:Uncharacterized protein n=1 Tax=Paenibacillus terricola TaxID=2763503 RepID=A0ABR8N4P8_9BACL|nr:hypothetical protein [Paenibacillus terricola]MBD3922185.1 hypothetical protein [Paenibacillus terricola]
MNSIRVRITVFVAASLFIAALYWGISSVHYQETYKHLNRNLNAAGIQIYQPEDEVVALLGDGEYMPGMGGHGRDYKEHGIRVNIPDDPSSSMYNRVSDVECYGTDCSVYGIKNGDEIADAVAVLLDQKYTKLVDHQGYTYENGEYFIILHGDQKVDSIIVRFQDPALMDRNY